LRRALLLSLPIAGALVLLWPEPDRDVLLSRGLARLLDAGAAQALASLPAERFSVAVMVDGRDRAREPLFARALNGALTQDERGPPLRLALEDRSAGVWLRIEHQGQPLASLGPWHPPGRVSLLPPLLAISLAVWLRRPVSALLAGVWAGAGWLQFRDGAALLPALVSGSLDLLRVHLRRELTESFRLELIGFVVALIAMVGVMSRGGGMAGMVERMLRVARDTRSTLLATFGMGLLLFFDDYSSCMIVGSAMRPLTDRLRVAREKLAYVVDSTAAPVAGVSIFSTWIAFEVSTFAPQLPAAGIELDGYAVFLLTLPYRFYCWLTLALVAGIVLSKRDFGPMLAAERRARSLGLLVREGGQPMISGAAIRLEPSAQALPRARNALLPVLCVVVVTVLELFRQGGGYQLLAGDAERLLTLPGLTGLMRDAGGSAPLLAGSCAGLWLATFLVASNRARVALTAGLLVAIGGGPSAKALFTPLLPAGTGAYAAGALLFAAGAALAALLGRAVPTRRRHVSFGELLGAAAAGVNGMWIAVAILFGAWMIGRICEAVGTADYLIALTWGALPAALLPALLFVVSSAVSFATGTSWGTMSILLPNVVVLAAAVGGEHPLGAVGMVVLTIGAVLEGAIFGDHCSPISDTTVLSSLSSASDHVDHVRTQAPYALCTAAAALLFGYIPCALLASWSAASALLAGVLVLALIVFLFGRDPERDVAPGPSA
jgi:Na+/H+ antiporter NhaC